MEPPFKSRITFLFTTSSFKKLNNTFINLTVMPLYYSMTLDMRKFYLKIAAVGGPSQKLIVGSVQPMTKVVKKGRREGISS